MAKTPAQLDREIAKALAGRTNRRSTHSTVVGATPGKSKRAAKTKLIHVVQGNYGYGQGWEDLTAEDTRKEALVRLREYRENEAGTPFRLIRRRERIGEAASAHARKKKLDHHEAKRLLEAEGIDFTRDYHAGVSLSQGNRIAEVARQAGYRKRKDAPGSTARMYFQHLSRLRHHATRRGKHTIYDLVEVNARTKKERVLHEHFSTKADAKEAADEYRARKRPDVTYRIKSRQVLAPPYRWNPED